jgi:hypothetical protein
LLTSAVNVGRAGSLAQAFDMAASAAATSESGGNIGANTGVINWSQYDGNIVEAINATPPHLTARSQQLTNSSKSSASSI